MRRNKGFFLAVFIFMFGLSACATTQQTDATNPDPKSIILATTTSTMDSGLLDVLIPAFTEQTGIEVQTISVGTGKAIQMGKDGEADVLLVHDAASELAFMEEGHGASRHLVMYNDFILLGSPDDPAHASEKSGSTILGALDNIAGSGSIFVSRGDDSGTHKLELRLWKAANIEPQGQEWYIEAGSGMGEVLKLANEKAGYTISDRATYLRLKDTLDMKIVCENDEALFNQYSVIVVNPDKNDQINHEGAEGFSQWIISPETQSLIGEFGVEEFGSPLFTPNAE